MSLGVRLTGPNSMPAWRLAVLRYGRLAPPKKIRKMLLQEERQADRDDHHGDQAGPAFAERFPEGLVIDEAERPRQHNAEDRSEDEGDSESDVEPPGDDGAESDDLAVREVRQPGGAVDQREPDGRQAR